MEKSTEKDNATVGYDSSHSEPSSLEESELAAENTLRSAAEYDLKEKITPS
jgi:hypothetical protein